MANILHANGSAGTRPMGIFHDDVLRRSNWAWAGASAVATLAVMLFGYMLSHGWMDTPARTGDVTKVEQSVSGIKGRLDSLETISAENARSLAVVIEGQRRADIAQERVSGQIAIITTALIARPATAPQPVRMPPKPKATAEDRGWRASISAR